MSDSEKYNGKTELKILSRKNIEKMQLGETFFLNDKSRLKTGVA